MRNIAAYLVIETEVDIDEEAFVSSFRRADTPSDMSTESILDLVSEMLAFDLEKLAGQVILALTIARPGGIRIDSVLILVNGKQIEEVSLHPTDITEARIEAEEMHWPPLSEISFARTFRWLIAAKGMKEGLPVGPLGRALSALSYICGWEPVRSPASDLMWCMIGLESLYTRGKQGLGEQLFDKTQSFLGSVSEAKKAFKGLYDYRSRFVHGDLDFPLAYVACGRADMHWQFEDEAYEAALRATALLLATLQEMVRRSLVDLSFQYVLIQH